MKGLLVRRARVDVWGPTMVSYLANWEICYNQGQELYTDAKGKKLELATSQLTGKKEAFLKYWVKGDGASGTCGAVTNVAEVPLTM